MSSSAPDPGVSVSTTSQRSSYRLKRKRNEGFDRTSSRGEGYTYQQQPSKNIPGKQRKSLKIHQSQHPNERVASRPIRNGAYSTEPDRGDISHVPTEEEVRRSTRPANISPASDAAAVDLREPTELGQDHDSNQEHRSLKEKVVTKAKEAVLLSTLFEDPYSLSASNSSTMQSGDHSSGDPHYARVLWDRAKADVLNKNEDHTVNRRLRSEADELQYSSKIKKEMLQWQRTNRSRPSTMAKLKVEHWYNFPPDMDDRRAWIQTLIGNDEDLFSCKDPTKGAGGYFHAASLPQLAFLSYFESKKQLGHKITGFEENINGQFICFLSTAIYHRLQQWSSGIFKQKLIKEDEARAVYLRQIRTWNNLPPDKAKEIVETFRLKACKAPSADTPKGNIDKWYSTQKCSSNGLQPERNRNNDENSNIQVQEE